ncbi:MAG: peptide ABC transporter substrate-binding protein, partial [Ruminococcus sp.]|nr:peptide ABC transporter substrate-binding protein [Ruminococcus sp.]
ELFEQAKSELETETLDNVKIIVSPDTADARVLHYLTQSWQELFGCYVAIEDVTEEEFEERIAEGDYNIAVYPLKAKMNSGLSVIKAYEDTPCLQYTLPEEKISDSIKNIPTASELVESYTAAEKKLIDTCGFVPLFYKNSYLIADRDNEDIIYDPFSGAVDYRLALNFD